ncbi:flagellar motor stator protein MotA [Rhodospirillaceae bacterium SYSU D60014]|uniref:flagellar motor stator protein MotA n=1 Tax=Virgifigura deserti TaxID=2268457 RepID=UPI000E67016D
MGPLIGILLVVAAVGGGYLGMGGNMSILWQPYEFVIVAGASAGIFVLAHPLPVVKDTLQAIGELFAGKREKEKDFLELLGLLYTLLRAVKSKGMLQLERHIEHPEESEFFQQYPTVLRKKRAVRFICDYLRLLSLGTAKPFEIEALMDEEIRILSKEFHGPTRALKMAAEGLPALGIVAAVLGVIKAMGAINEPPEVLGQLIGGALLGTFLGVFLSYGVVDPIASLIRVNRESSISYFVSIKSTILAHLNGAAPQVAVEYGRKVIHSQTQPSFAAVEEATILDTELGKAARASVKAA